MSNRTFRYRPLLRGITLSILLAGLSLSTVSAQQAIPLGSEMPMTDHTLQNVEGEQTTLADVRGETGTVVVFWSNQCPWIDKYEDRLMALADEYGSQGVRFVLLNANDAQAYPRESLDEIQAQASDYGEQVVYLKDADSAVAKAFGAERTPHVFVFDGSHALVYVGTIDDSPGDPGNVTKTYLADALQALVEGSDIPVAQTKAFGCTIKVASGSE